MAAILASLEMRARYSGAIFRTVYLVRGRHQPVGSSISETDQARHTFRRGQYAEPPTVIVRGPAGSHKRTAADDENSLPDKGAFAAGGERSGRAPAFTLRGRQGIWSGKTGIPALCVGDHAAPHWANRR